MKVLLIGGNGYIGSGISHALVKLGHTILHPGNRFNINKLDHSDIEGADFVINASVIIDKKSKEVDNRSRSFNVNVNGTSHLALLCSQLDIPLVHLSTRDVFGDGFLESEVMDLDDEFLPQTIIKTTTPTRPTTQYGKTKAMGEMFVLAHPKNIVLRLSSPYSTLAHKNAGWIYKFCEAAVKGNIVTLSSSGKQYRDPIHTDDIAELITLIVGKLSGIIHISGGPANVGSLREHAKTIGVAYTVNPSITDYGFVFDNTEINVLTGWLPKVLFKEEIEKIKESIKYESKNN